MQNKKRDCNLMIKPNYESILNNEAFYLNLLISNFKINSKREKSELKWPK